ncbi:MAG: hypothetical protein AB7U82_12970 [Blastocatellales bacterium]
MKIGKKHWRPSPPLIVIATAVIVITGMLLAGWLNARSYRTKARVEIADPVTEASAPTLSTTTKTSGLPDGEVARMALRIREATGVLMGLALLAVNEQMNNRNVASVDALIALMSTRGLLPPGVKLTTTKSELASDHATIYVRFRPQPLGLEVVSVGRDRLDGPPLIARLSTGGDDNTGALLLVAKRTEGNNLPEPFASPAEIASLNWNIEPLRERQFTSQEIDSLNLWARQYADK